MRDQYQRKQRLQSWIEKINTDLDESDKNDVLRLVEHMQDRERSILWIIRCIALFTIRKKTGKPFKDVTKQDIRSFLKWMEQKSYKSSTNEKFIQILKLLFKIVCGNEGEYHPDQVKWFSVKLGKEKVGNYQYGYV